MGSVQSTVVGGVADFLGLLRGLRLEIQDGDILYT